MKLSNKWEKEWQEIKVPKDETLNAIRMGLSSSKTTITPKPIHTKKSKLQFLKKYRWQFATVAALVLTLGIGFGIGKGTTNNTSMQMRSYETLDGKSEMGIESQVSENKVTENNAPSQGGEKNQAPADNVKEQAGETSSTKKIVKTVTIEKETTDFNGVIEKISQSAKAYNGRVDQSTIEGKDVNTGLKSGFFVFRIPQESLEKFLAEIKSVGETTLFYENSDNQSLNYSDNQSRINALKAEEKALLALLEKSEKVTDMLEIQSRLSVIRGDIESFEQQNRMIDDQVTESTVTLTIREVNKVTKTQDTSIFNLVKNNWKNHLDSWKLFGSSLLVFVLSNGLFILLAIFLGLFIWWIGKKKQWFGKNRESSDG